MGLAGSNFLKKIVLQKNRFSSHIVLIIEFIAVGYSARATKEREKPCEFRSMRRRRGRRRRVYESRHRRPHGDRVRVKPGARARLRAGTGAGRRSRCPQW